MRAIRILVILGASASLTLPAAAVPFCHGGSSGLHFGFGMSFGERLSQRDIDEFDLMRLRQLGVDASSVERWNGCIRAFVRKPGGGEEMQFFDPNSYRRVY